MMANSEDLSSWYEQISNGGIGQQVPQENNNFIAIEKEAKRSAVPDLLYDAIQLNSYAQILTRLACSIEQDIKYDIASDSGELEEYGTKESTTFGVDNKIIPLKRAVENKENLINISKNISSLVTSIVSILDRVKIKD